MVILYLYLGNPDTIGSDSKGKKEELGFYDWLHKCKLVLSKCMEQKGVMIPSTSVSTGIILDQDDEQVCNDAHWCLCSDVYGDIYVIYIDV